MKFKPLVVARDALMVDPVMGRKKLSKAATSVVVEDDLDDKFAVMMSSERQTEAFHLVEE